MNATAALCLVLLQFTTIRVLCDPNIWLTVSSTVVRANGKIKQRVLELNWNNINVGKQYWIGLFHSKIEKVASKSKAMVVLMPTEHEGKYRTEIEFPVKLFTPSIVGTKCLGFYIAYCKSRRVLAKNCIKLNAKWMEEIYEHIRYRSLTSLMIPGTHNAASYYEGYKDVNFIQNIVDNYSICQDENIFNQLVYGIRYLDLRVMYDGVLFWMAHDVFKMQNTLDSVLEQIRTFLDSTNKEVVIVDFHRFPKGFEENKKRIHKQLLALLEYHLNPYLSEATDEGYNVTIDKLVISGKRVIIGYAEFDIDRPSYLYQPVRHRWANADRVTFLHEYMKTVCKPEHSTIANAAMAELTAKALKLVLNVYGGVRQMADDVNSKVTKWFRDELSSCANIVATDFFLGNNIIEVSIVVNKRRKNFNFTKHL